MLPALLLVGACSTRSEVVELAPDLFALTSKSATPAAAARLGVEEARAHCTSRGLGFEAVRSAIGSSEYQIAFRCPRPAPEALTPPGEEANSRPPNPFLR